MAHDPGSATSRPRGGVAGPVAATEAMPRTIRARWRPPRSRMGRGQRGGACERGTAPRREPPGDGTVRTVAVPGRLRPQETAALPAALISRASPEITARNAQYPEREPKPHQPSSGRLRFCVSFLLLSGGWSRLARMSVPDASTPAREAIDAFLRHLADRGLSATTRRIRKTYLNEYLRHAQQAAGGDADSGEDEGTPSRPLTAGELMDGGRAAAWLVSDGVVDSRRHPPDARRPDPRRLRQRPAGRGGRADEGKSAGAPEQVTRVFSRRGCAAGKPPHTVLKPARPVGKHRSSHGVTTCQSLVTAR